MLTLSESYYQRRVNKFSEFISNITGTLIELLPNNTTHFSRRQATLTFSESYWQILLYTFPEFLERRANYDNEIWEKIINSIKKEFDRKPVHNEKYLKAKIKSYNGKFHNKIKYHKNVFNLFVYQ